MFWLLTDTHLGHTNLIRYCGRPHNFSTIILNNLQNLNWNTHDILIHLGDFCFGNDAEWHTKFMTAIPDTVTKILIKGNHDRRTLSWYRKHGWSAVFNHLLIEKFGKKIAISHVPLNDSQNFDINIHGHFHNNPLEKCEDYLTARLTPKHRRFALEDWQYQPISLRKALKQLPQTREA